STALGEWAAYRACTLHHPGKLDPHCQARAVPDLSVFPGESICAQPSATVRRSAPTGPLVCTHIARVQHICGRHQRENPGDDELRWPANYVAGVNRPYLAHRGASEWRPRSQNEQDADGDGEVSRH